MKTITECPKSRHQRPVWARACTHTRRRGRPLEQAFRLCHIKPSTRSPPKQMSEVHAGLCQTIGHTHQRRDNSYSEGEARMKICTDLRSITFVTCHHRRLDPSQSSPTPTKQSTGICAHAESRLPTHTTTKKTLVVVIVVTQDTTSDPPNNRLCTCQPWCRTHPSPRKREGDR